MVSILIIMGHTNLIAFYAPYSKDRDFSIDLEQELKLRGFPIVKKYDRLILCETISPLPNVVFSSVTWHNVKIVNFESINQAASILKDSNPKLKFYYYSTTAHRRAELISQKISTPLNKRYAFLEEIPSENLGAFYLIDANTLLYSLETSSSLPFGEIEFLEDKTNPPSRAYLKLWELFTLHKIKPHSHERVVDMGSCPGGWTWVLQSLGCRVVSVDKAPLAPHIAALPNIEFRQESAFGLRPAHLGDVDWFFSDIICYPEKLYELVQRHLQQGHCEQFACTIKFQGTTDFETMFKFEQIPHSKIVHLHANKHEVTWIKTKNPDLN